MNPHLDELISLCRNPKIQGHIGTWMDGDRYFWDGQIELFSHMTDTDEYGNLFGYLSNATWIPPLSDPLRPERSLIGMIGEKSISIEIGNHRLWYCKISVGYAVTGEIVFDSFPGPTPEIAVCRAIIAQEEER